MLNENDRSADQEAIRFAAETILNYKDGVTHKSGNRITFDMHATQLVFEMEEYGEVMRQLTIGGKSGGIALKRLIDMNKKACLQCAFDYFEYALIGSYDTVDDLFAD